MSVPAERVWIIDHVVEVAAGAPGAMLVPDEQTGAARYYVPDPNAVSTGMLEIAAILSRIGGVVTLATRRKEISPGHAVTLATVVRWRSFAPLEKAQEAPVAEQEQPPAAEPPAEPVSEPEPVEEPQAA